MFERFTDRARRAVVLASEEARGYGNIGTEHLMLALIREGEGVAAKVLTELGITHDVAAEHVQQIIGPPGPPRSGHLPFTPRCKKVLELALRDALQLGHNYIGTEHVLLGLLREGEGVACAVIVASGVELSDVRAEVMRVLAGYITKPEPGVEQYQVDPDRLASLYAAVLTEPIVQNLITRRVIARLRAEGTAP